MATESDVVAGAGGEKRLYELACGVLVEKPMGYYESLLAGILIQILSNFLAEDDLGIVLGEAGTLRLAPGLVRIPDVSFISWSHFPNRELPAEPIPDLAPDLAVEVLSEGNTPQEMALKLREYFSAGVRLVWYVDPAARTAAVYTSPDACDRLGADEDLSASAVLPGFTLRLGDWLDRVPRPGKRG